MMLASCLRFELWRAFSAGARHARARQVGYSGSWESRKLGSPSGVWQVVSLAQEAQCRMLSLERLVATLEMNLIGMEEQNAVMWEVKEELQCEELQQREELQSKYWQG